MKKINFHGDSKVINYIVSCINWFIDNHAVSKLDDVTLTNIADGQILKYDSQSGKFVNDDESGGTEVEANPQGTATDTLSTIDIDGTIYEVGETPNDSTITIQKNGTTVESFGLNQNSDEIINITMNKNDVGLGNVDNTSDADKPISTATQTALNAKASTADLGTASAKNFTTSVTQGSNDLVTSGAVYNEFANLPKPEIFKGTLGVNGTITTLPTASSDNEGWEYKVITAGTYAGQDAKYGDTFISDGTQWVYIPSGDETDTDTWRGINVNGTQLLGNGTSSGNVNFKGGTNAQVSGSGNDITVDVDTTFADASSRVNIASGDSIKTILSKIKKFFADLKTVAFTNSYNDLDNKPTIPTVNNGTLTINQNGNQKGTFTANQSGNTTIDLTDTDSVTGVKGNNESTYRTGNVNLTSDNVEAVRKLFDLNTALGSGSPASTAKTYFLNNINNISVEVGYNSNGSEYALIFGRGSASYGAILRFSYVNKYLEILRRHPSGQYDGWYSEGWEKIWAGQADTALNDSDGNNIASTYLKKTGGDVTGLLRIIGGAIDKRFKTRNIVGLDSTDNPSEEALYLQYGNTVNDNVFFGETAGGAITNNGTEYNGNSATSYKIKYGSVLDTADKLDAFLEADRFKMARFGGWSAEDMAKASYPGITNGMILSGGYYNTNYGFQIAIDDDPGYFMTLRQKGGNDGWSAWKRIPMADGTGANSTWGINVTGSAGSATNDSDGNQINTTYTKKVVATIPNHSNHVEGWYRLCKISSAVDGVSNGYANGFIVVRGDWANGSPSSAIIAVNTVNDNLKFTLISNINCSGLVTQIRAVNVSGGTFWLDAYMKAQTGNVDIQYFDMIGTLNVSDIQNSSTPLTGTATATDTVNLTTEDVYGVALTPQNINAHKPSYTLDEIGSGYVKIGDGTNYILWRFTNTWRSGVYYQTYGDEATVFANQNTRASWIFANTDPEARTQWNQLTNVAMHIKNGKVAIGKLIPNSQYLTDTLEVNGTVGISTSGSITSGNTQAVTGGTVYNYLAPTEETPTTNFYARKSGKVVNIECCEADGGDLNTASIPSGYRPKRDLIIPCKIVVASKIYIGEFKIDATYGSLYAYYYTTYGATSKASALSSGNKISFNTSYIID